MTDSTLHAKTGNAPTIKTGHTRTNAFGADAFKKRTGPGATATDLPDKP